MTEHTTKLDAVGTNDCKVTTETLHAQPAAPPAPTMYECHKHGAVAGDHCPQCRVVAYVDVSNAPDTRPAEAQEPKANEWMRRAMEQFIYHTEHEPMSSEDALEIGVQVIAAHAPDVTALGEAAEKALDTPCDCEQPDGEGVHTVSCAHSTARDALYTAIAAVKKERA